MTYERTLTGTVGANTLTGDGRPELIQGLGGNDTLNGLGGADRLEGGDNNDKLFGGDGDDILVGGAGQDSLTGGAGTDIFVLAAGDGANTIADFQDGADLIDISGYGGTYSSIVQLTSGAKIIFADGGYVILTGVQASALSAADFITGAPPPPPPPPPPTYNLITGTEGPDTLHGTGAADQIQGLGAADTITGEGGDDLLEGGAGNDALYGGAGADILTGEAGQDLFVNAKGSGEDRVTDFTLGEDRVDATDGLIGSYLDGADTVVILQAGVTLRLVGLGVATLGDPSYHGLAGTQPDPYVVTAGDGAAQTLTGGTGRDVLDGQGGADILFGGQQDDLLIGGAGADALHGGRFDQDYLVGGAGADVFFAEVDGGFDIVADFEVGLDKIDVSAFGQYASIVQDGFDTVITVDNAGQVKLRLAGVTATSITDDSFIGLPSAPAGSDRTITGTANANTINGDDRFDTILGLDGNDTLDGLGGDDRLEGGTGGDRLYGGAGADVLIGGAGQDTLRGDGGADRFVFGPGDGANTILDFEDGIDRIDVTAYGGYTKIVQLEAGAKVFFADGGYVILSGFSTANLSDADFVGLAAPIPAGEPKDGWFL